MQVVFRVPNGGIEKATATSINAMGVMIERRGTHALIPWQTVFEVNTTIEGEIEKAVDTLAP